LQEPTWHPSEQAGRTRLGAAPIRIELEPDDRACVLPGARRSPDQPGRHPVRAPITRSPVIAASGPALVE